MINKKSLKKITALVLATAMAVSGVSLTAFAYTSVGSKTTKANNESWWTSVVSTANSMGLSSVGSDGYKTSYYACATFVSDLLDAGLGSEWNPSNRNLSDSIGDFVSASSKWSKVYSGYNTGVASNISSWKAGSVILHKKTSSGAYSHTALLADNGVYSAPGYTSSSSQYYGRYRHMPFDQYFEYVAVGESSGEYFEIWEYVSQGTLNLKKVGNFSDLTAGLSCYSIEGAVYGVYKTKSGDTVSSKVGELTTTATGTTNTLTLDAGTYYVKELVAPKGYLIDEEIHTVTVTSGGANTLSVSDDPAFDPIGVVLKKVDADTGEAVQQGEGSMQGATYRIKYFDVSMDNDPEESGHVAERYWDFETNEKGMFLFEEEFFVGGDEFYYSPSGEVSIPIGTITIEEIVAPTGYRLEDVIHVRQIAVNEQATGVQSYNVPISNEEIIRGGVSIHKNDIETGVNVAQGNTTFNGVEFTIYSENEAQVYVNENLYNKGEAVDTLVVVEGIAKSNNDLLPYGTYSIKETKEPVGYFGTDEVKEFSIREDGVIIEFHNDEGFFNQIKRGDLDLTKVEETTMQRMENIPFQITSKTTGENHIIMTDINGYASTHSDWNPHSQNTNRGDTSEDGVWFGELSALDDKKGALPYDTYIIEEVRVENNTDHNIFEPFEIIISRDSHTVGLGTVTNEQHDIQLETTAYDKEDKDKIVSAGEEVTIVDTVIASNLTLGQEYTIKGILMDKSTEKPFESFGKTVESETTFTATAKEVTVELEFTFDSIDITEETTLVVYERIYSGGWELATHTDINDEDQTVVVKPIEIDTEATDQLTGEHETSIGGEINIVDKVTYTGLIVGREYTLKGVLIDKTTGEEFLIKGEKVEAELMFTPESSDGYVELVFTFDSKHMSDDSTIVVFERLYRENRLVATHTDIEDEDQTVVVKKIEIKTEATDSVTKDHIGLLEEELTIIDTVSLIGLVPDLEYTIKGVLMNKETGEEFLVKNEDNEETSVTTELIFTAQERNEVHELNFTFTGENITKDMSLVVFEYLYLGEDLIAKHDDIDDEDQTVTYTEIEIDTIASANDTYTAGSVVEVKDTVTYKNLLVGVEYKLEGILMDKATGEVFLVNGKPVISMESFTPSERNGEITLTFEFEATMDMGDLHLVVFEFLFDSDKELITTHTDIDDEDQTVLIKYEEEIPPSDIPKTGDYTKILLPLLGLGVSLIGGLYFIKRKKANIVKVRK